MACYEIVYSGKGISLNDVRGGNWRKSHEKIKQLKTVMCWLILEAKIGKLNRFHISLSYNCAYDVDNCAYMCKICSDSLKTQGRIVDDTPKFYKGISITVDETLPKNTFKFLISEVN
jgi:hypothetical protein